MHREFKFSLGDEFGELHLSMLERDATLRERIQTQQFREFVSEAAVAGASEGEIIVRTDAKLWPGLILKTRLVELSENDTYRDMTRPFHPNDTIDLN